MQFFNNKYFKLLLYINLPLLIFGILGYFEIPKTKILLKEFVAFGIFTSLIYSLVTLFSSKVKKYVLAIITLFLSLLVFIKISFYHHYKVRIDASAYYVIFESNKTESIEFLKFYFDNYVFVISVLFLSLPLFVYFDFSKKETIKITKPLKLLSFLGICISASIIFLKFKRENLIYNSILSYTEYKEFKKNLKSELAKPLSPFVSVQEINNKDKETYVVIIGESTSNWHMQLYGYKRETNPLLSEIKEELLIFKNVITSNTHTIIALDKILTFSDYQFPNKKNNTSIVQLANAAGYSTYWITNQRPVGLHESVSTIIGQAANKFIPLSLGNSNEVSLDEKILPELKKVLNNKEEKKLIFIHLMGTHGLYEYRYPNSFNQFTNRPKHIKINTTDKAIKLINEYDNAVSYNDYIVRSIIDQIKALEDKSFVVYFSDHGDELYDTIDFVGHNEYLATKPMYEIPFIVWISDKYKKEYKDSFEFKTYLKRKYILEDFIQSFSDLTKIKNNKFDSTKSIFSPNFKLKKRLIKKNIDYDK
ncbi:sulfatase-like hydrolase/transferase [Mesoflavibacter sp. CH_XMU1422-2]|uniref:sulfatase-like hydrolase/transferase n=1 Tax=Mesoflavibacter sp. CH_XMU1422-2 TaxID=3107770 RepID=UPI00300B5260